MSKEILPMKLEMSDAFRKVLEDSDSIIAKKLLALDTLEGCPEWINYLDVAKDDASKISYLNKSRYLTVEGKTLNWKDLEVGQEFTIVSHNGEYGGRDFNLTNYMGTKVIITKVCSEIKAECVCIKGDSKEGLFDDFWFRPYDIDLCNPLYQHYNPNIRYMASCGKVIQKLLGVQNGKDLAKFCELFQAYHPDFRFTTDFDLDFVKGEDIRYWYLEDNYEYEDSGELGSSCMKYNKCQKYFDLYTKNDIVQMFVAKTKNNGKLVARCIIWDNKYFDRVYASDTVLSEKVIAYLKSLGLQDVFVMGDSENITLSLDYGTNELEYFPYCDTFRYIQCDEISTTHDNFNNCYTLNDTDGHYEEYDRCICAVSGDPIDEDDAIYIDDLGYVDSQYAQYCRTDDTYYLSEDTVYCKWMDDYLHENDVTCLYDEEYTADFRAIHLHDGDYADQDDEDLVELENGHALVDDCEYSELNGFYILKDEAHYCDMQEDWVYEHQLENEQNEEIIEA